MSKSIHTTAVRLAAGVLVLGLAAGGLLASETRGSTKKAPERKGDPYPLATCPVTGESLTAMGAPVTYLDKGREIRFCCKGCVRKFKKDPEKYSKKIDAQIIKQQKPFYPLATCLVSGEKLGAMGKTVDYVYGNRLIRLCCKGCIRQIEKDPKRFLKKLDKAVIEKQGSAYPVKTCVVSGEKLGAMGKPVDRVVANRLVRFCCKGCIKSFEKNPAKYLKKLPAAGAAKAGGSAEKQHGPGERHGSGEKHGGSSHKH